MNRIGSSASIPVMAAICMLFVLIPACSQASESSFLPANSPRAQANASSPPFVDTAAIPGPLRSFLRMAGISQEIEPAEVLPLLAVKVFTDGYVDGRPTEFLLLVERYLQQARELQSLAPGGAIRISGCGDIEPLLRILGYRIVHTCGQPDADLVTDNADRAFLTVDSGFPLTRLEQSVQHGTPFDYPYTATQVPILFREGDWAYISSWRERGSQDLVDILLHDPAVARLYLALSEEDSETRLALLSAPGLVRLLPYAAVLDFYGSEITIRSGHVQVPGGPSANRIWASMTGANPDRSGDFVLHLLQKDNGWLALYYDTLCRIPAAERDHLTKPSRLKRLYEALREPGIKENAGMGSYRRGASLLVLFSTLQWQPDDEPLVPGGLGAWKEILRERFHSKTVRTWARGARHWHSPEQLLTALVAFSRIRTNDGPLQIYLMLAAMDRARSASERLPENTVRLLAADFTQYGSWYPVFVDFPQMNSSSIQLFLSLAHRVDKISDDALRANTLGILQADIGIWRILARQGQIAPDQLNATWQQSFGPFEHIASATDLLDVGRASLDDVVLAAGGPRNPTEDQIIDLLAGPKQSNAAGEAIHVGMAHRIKEVLDDQRLASMDTIFALGDGLHAMAQGHQDSARLEPLAAEIQEFEMPRPIFTQSEKTEWAAGVYTNRHAQLQVKANLVNVVKHPASIKEIEQARGRLASFLRDTLVGLNYAYYEPPESQLMHNNPLFVRSHDFARQTIISSEPLWEKPDLLGVGSPAGGGAYLVGSLADLPYALAGAEQDFIAPRHVQALIWQDLVPDLMVSGILPRWWNISPQELHAVALYQSAGEELLRAAATNPELRIKVLDILSNRMSPKWLESVKIDLAKGGADVALHVTPADSFFLTADFLRDYPLDSEAWGPSGQDLRQLRQTYPAQTSVQRISKDFGVPHPALLNSYDPQLEDRQLSPVFGGYYSRLFGQSWDSNNLYWARLADEMGYSPAVLNRLVPDLTGKMVSRIFATDIHDWPAVLRAMRSTGQAFRHSKLTPAEETAQAL